MVLGSTVCYLHIQFLQTGFSLHANLKVWSILWNCKVAILQVCVSVIMVLFNSHHKLSYLLILTIFIATKEDLSFSYTF